MEIVQKYLLVRLPIALSVVLSMLSVTVPVVAQTAPTTVDVGSTVAERYAVPVASIHRDGSLLRYRLTGETRRANFSSSYSGEIGIDCTARTRIEYVSTTNFNGRIVTTTASSPEMRAVYAGTRTALELDTVCRLANPQPTVPRETAAPNAQPPANNVPNVGGPTLAGKVAVAQVPTASVTAKGIESVPGSKTDSDDGAKKLDALTKKAEAGEKDAQFKLGSMYLKARGAPSIEKQGVEWLRRAAKQGHAGARLKLAQMDSQPKGRGKGALPTIQELRAKYPAAAALTDEELIEYTAKFYGMTPAKLKEVIGDKPSRTGSQQIESKQAVTWDSLSPAPPPSGVAQVDPSSKASSATDWSKFVPEKPVEGGGPTPYVLDKLGSPNSNETKSEGASARNTMGATGAVLMSVMLASACAYFIWLLIGRNVKGLTPIATGRRWMAWAAAVTSVTPLTKFFSQLIGGYGKATDSLALAVLGAIVSGAVAFGAGALWGHVRKPKSQHSGLSMALGDPQQAEPGNSAHVNERVPAGHDVELPSGARVATPSDLVPPVNDNQSFATASEEIETGSIDKGLWARLYAEADGDEAKTKARYIKQRAAAIDSAQEPRRAQEGAAAEADSNRLEVDGGQREGLADAVLANSSTQGQQVPGSGSFMFGLLRLIRVICGVFFAMQIVGLFPVLTWLQRPDAATSGMWAQVLIKVLALALFGWLFFWLRNVINRLHTKRHDVPHPALEKKKWAL